MLLKNGSTSGIRAQVRDSGHVQDTLSYAHILPSSPGVCRLKDKNDY